MQIYKLELEQKRLEEDAFVYNWLQQQLKLSPAYKKVMLVLTQFKTSNQWLCSREYEALYIGLICLTLDMLFFLDLRILIADIDKTTDNR